MYYKTDQKISTEEPVGKEGRTNRGGRGRGGDGRRRVDWGRDDENIYVCCQDLTD